MGVYIRIALPSDVDWIVDRAKQFPTVYGETKIMIDNENIRERTLFFIKNFVLLIAEDPMRGPVGFILGAITPHLFNPKIKVFAEFMLWVDPSSRNGMTTHLLIDYFTKYGKKNADLVTFSVRDGASIKDSSLKKFGYNLVEKSYLIEVGC